MVIAHAQLAYDTQPDLFGHVLSKPCTQAGCVQKRSLTDGAFVLHFEYKGEIQVPYGLTIGKGALHGQ